MANQTLRVRDAQLARAQNLVYMGDNLEDTLDAASLAQRDVVDQDVRAFASCLIDPLFADLQNIDTLRAGGTVSLGGGGGKGPSDGKGVASPLSFCYEPVIQRAGEKAHAHVADVPLAPHGSPGGRCTNS